jgi:hypothetical protein
MDVIDLTGPPAMERPPTASRHEREEMMQAIREITLHARSMQMERDGWKAEAERLEGMAQKGTEALLGERNY